MSHDILAGFNQNEASVFINMQFSGKYLNASDSANILNLPGDPNVYDNAFAYARLSEWFDDQTPSFLSCANEFYSSGLNNAYMNNYYNETMDFNLNSAENLRRNSRSLAWSKIEKMISDMHYVCSSLDLKNSISVSGHFYNYKFNKRSPLRMGKKAPKWFGVTHGDEMEFVFGMPFVRSSFQDADRKLSARVMNYWANFARTGRL